MTLDYSRHKNILLQILKDIYSDTAIAPYLGFKGGTAAAMYERIGKTSRDIYDVYFFTKNHWPINREIVEQRAHMPFKDLLAACVVRLEKMDDRHILDGLGELLAESKKDWVRAKLRAETIFLLRARLASEK